MRQTFYYVDAVKGSDRNRGTSPRGAWKTVERVRAAVFAPGDQVLFAAGQTFPGTLRLEKPHRGSQDLPLIVSSFGRGRATLDGGSGDAVDLTDCAHVHVRNLHVVGCGRKNGSNGTGIKLTRTQHVHLDNIEARGFREAGVSTGGDSDTRITHVRAHDNGFAGITVYGGHDGLPRSRNLYIGDCVVYDNPGDPQNLTNHSGNGIVVGGLDEALIEYCEAYNNGWDMPRKGNGPVGIWGWNCDRLTIQHCISHDNKSPGMDGGGFDFDGGVTNSVLQYNLSYNNVGCGYLLCQYPGAAPWKNNVVRYNISLDDGRQQFHSGIGLWLGDSGISDAQIYNNTIVNAHHAVATLGDIPRMVYRNNIFWCGGDALVGDFSHSRFENNLYWLTGKDAVVYRGEKDSPVYATLEAWAEATGQEMLNGKRVGLVADPKIALPAGSRRKLPTNPRTLSEMPSFRLHPDSPCVGAGVVVPARGERDLFGNRLAARGRGSLGAHERGKT